MLAMGRGVGMNTFQDIIENPEKEELKDPRVISKSPFPTFSNTLYTTAPIHPKPDLSNSSGFSKAFLHVIVLILIAITAP